MIHFKLQAQVDFVTANLDKAIAERNKIPYGWNPNWIAANNKVEQIRAELQTLRDFIKQSKR